MFVRMMLNFCKVKTVASLSLHPNGPLSMTITRAYMIEAGEKPGKSMKAVKEQVLSSPDSTLMVEELEKMCKMVRYKQTVQDLEECIKHLKDHTQNSKKYQNIERKAKRLRACIEETEVKES